MNRDLNFTKMIQTIFRFGIPYREVIKIFPYRKDIAIRDMRQRFKHMGLEGAFWLDLYRKDEAYAQDKFGGKIHFKLIPFNGDYADEVKANQVSKRD